MTVAEMLQLARDVKAGIVTCQYMLAPAVIELLDTPDTALSVTVDKTWRGTPTVRTENLLTEHVIYANPEDARSLAVALLRAADEAEGAK